MGLPGHQPLHSKLALPLPGAIKCLSGKRQFFCLHPASLMAWHANILGKRGIESKVRKNRTPPFSPLMKLKALGRDTDRRRVMALSNLLLKLFFVITRLRTSSPAPPPSFHLMALKGKEITCLRSQHLTLLWVICNEAILRL